MGEIDWTEWAGLPNPIAEQLEQLNMNRLENFARVPGDFAALVNAVLSASNGPYKDRQLYELIQNAADVLTTDQGEDGGRIRVVLSDDALYCANQGRPFTSNGFKAVSTPNVSAKDDLQAIGQFGIGFMSVAEITTRPEIYSKTCSVRYSLDDALGAFFPDLVNADVRNKAKHVYAMAYAVPVDPKLQSAEDPILRELMEWATTVIKLPLDREDHELGPVRKKLALGMREFPPEFLLFCRHVKSLEFEIRESSLIDSSSWHFKKVDSFGYQSLKNVSGSGSIQVSRVRIPESGSGSELSEWMVFSDVDIPIHEVLDGSDRGLERARKEDENGRLVPVTLTWAINVKSPGKERGAYWFFFPTQDEVTLRGIVNAPWDTNTGRTLLLDPRTNGYNKALLRRLAYLVLTAIPTIAGETTPDVCKFLELVPARGREESYDASKWFVPEFWRIAQKHSAIPNLDGTFRHPGELTRWPDDVVSGISSANPYAINVAVEWARLSTDRDFPHLSAYKNRIREGRLDIFFQGAEDAEQ